MINRFNEKVEILKIEKVDNGRGGWTEKENSIGFFWTYYVPQTVDKALQYRQLDVEATARFYFLEDERIATDCFIRRKDVDYEIVSIALPGQQSFFMEVLANGERQR